MPGSAMTPEQEKALARYRKLRALASNVGAADGERAQASRSIGKLLADHPDLLYFDAAHPEQPNGPEAQDDAAGPRRSRPFVDPSHLPPHVRRALFGAGHGLQRTASRVQRDVNDALTDAIDAGTARLKDRARRSVARFVDDLFDAIDGDDHEPDR